MDPRIHIDRSMPILASRLQVGVTLTKITPAEPWAGPVEARERANAHVEAMRGAWYNQHIAGWGVDANTIFPAPDKLNWADFDRRMRWLLDRKVEHVILTCYGAPDWATIPGLHPRYRMLAPSCAELYAAFCVKAIERALSMGVPIKAVQFWNELKGYGTHGGDWDIVSYTDAYNAWSDALRSRPDLDDLLIGGPYMILENGIAITERNLQTLEHWRDLCWGADAVAVVHALSHGGTGVLPQDDYLEDTAVFGEIVSQLRYAFPGREIWFAEHYCHSDTAQYDTLDIQFQAAFSASMLRSELLGGASLALNWGLTGDNRLAPGGCIASWLTDPRLLVDKGLATDTGIAPGDKTPLYDVYHAFHTYFGPGQAIYEAVCSDPLIEVLASANATMLINNHDAPQVVRLGNETLSLGRYEVRVIPEPVLSSVEDIARRVVQQEIAALGLPAAMERFARGAAQEATEALRGDLVAAVDRLREGVVGE